MFTNGGDAIHAAADALDNLVGRVCRPDGTPLQVRIGIHCGPGLVVPLNGINDYFGSTVNIAARIESKASDGECLVSETVLDDPVTKAALDKMFTGGTFTPEMLNFYSRSWVHNKSPWIPVQGRHYRHQPINVIQYSTIAKSLVQAACQSRSDGNLVQLGAEIMIVILNKQSLARNVLTLLKDNG
jgi:hypothetical protein